jgi:predicted ATPase/DNA-binding SARP family transcriptional activator
MSGMPLPLTAFVGRTRELAAMTELLRGTRLVTLTGAGGAGKTRLAREFAVQSDLYRGRTVWVELGPIADAALVPQHVGAALGLHDTSGGVIDVQRLIDDREMLLVLDNCEHVVEACALLTEALLRGCPRLHVLATSREPLRVPAEVAWSVPALALPRGSGAASFEAAQQAEAVQLFVARARNVLPAFRITADNAPAVAHICMRLDGLPLAIELAAARVHVLPPERIAERLDDVFRVLAPGARTAVPRHRTLWAAIDWSYALLGEAEQRLFRRLSIFSGGFTLEAAELVGAGEEITSAEVLDLLAALLEKSLVWMSERDGYVRYDLLETVRQFAIQRLRESGEEALLKRRHAACFLSLAQRAASQVGTSAVMQWTRALQLEQDNLRRTMDWAAGPDGDPQLELALAGSIAHFWRSFGSTRELRARLESALERAGSSAPTPQRALALSGAATLAWSAGDNRSARGRAEEACVLWRQFGDPRNLTISLNALGQILKDVDELESARSIAEESVAVARADESLGPAMQGLALLGLGAVLQTAGDTAGATAALLEAEPLWSAAGQPYGHSMTLGRLSLAALHQDDLPAAAALARRSIEVLRRAPDLWLAGRGLHLVAAVLARQGDALRAARMLGAAESLRERTGAVVLAFEREVFNAAVHAVRSAADEQACRAAWEEGRGMDLEAVLDSALEVPSSAEGYPEVDAAPAAPRPQRQRTAVDAAQAPDLRVLALGPLQVWRRAEPLDPGAWGSAKTRELLVYLSCHADGRTKEQIGLALWPEISTAQVRNNLHTTLYRLRKGIGEAEWIVLERERYRLAPGLRLELDAAVFELEVTAALRHRPLGEPDARRLAGALIHYRGAFLDGEVVADWHLEIRDRLQLLHEHASSALGEYYLHMEQYEQARQMFWQLVLSDPLNEEASRSLMLALVRLGEPSQARRLYQRLSAMLRAELDSEPQPATTALYQRLLRADSAEPG